MIKITNALVLRKFPVETTPNGKRRATILLQCQDSEYAKEFLAEVYEKGISYTYDQVNEGDTVDMEVNINSREYNGKYYTTVFIGKITNNSAGNGKIKNPYIPAKQQTISKAEINNEPNEDLPF